MRLLSSVIVAGSYCYSSSCQFVVISVNDVALVCDGDTNIVVEVVARLIASSVHSQ